MDGLTKHRAGQPMIPAVVLLVQLVVVLVSFYLMMKFASAGLGLERILGPHVQWAILTLVAGAVVISHLITNQRLKRQMDKTKGVAARTGMEYHLTLDGIEGKDFSAFPLFQSGRLQKALHGLNRTNELVFTFSYDARSGTSGGSISQTVAALRAPGRSLPRFKVEPEMILHKFIDAALGVQDIDFDNDPEFSKKFHLQGSDETAVRTLFTSWLRRELAGNPGWSLEGQGEWLLVYKANQAIEPTRIPSFLEQARKLSRLLG